MNETVWHETKTGGRFVIFCPQYPSFHVYVYLITKWAFTFHLMSACCPCFSFWKYCTVYMQNKEWPCFFYYLIFLIPNVFDPPVQYLQKKYISFIYYKAMKVSMFSVLVLMEYNTTKPLFEALNVQL